MNERIITITVMGGCVTDVDGLPEGWTYVLDDHDIIDDDDEPTGGEG